MEEVTGVQMLVTAILGGICFVLVGKYIKQIFEVLMVIGLIVGIVLFVAFMAGDLPI